jgi:hypothetical protein
MERAKTTTKKVEDFKTLLPLLEAMYAEFQELSKKKQDGQVGATKVKMVNRLLKAVHSVLENEPNHAFLDLLDEDDLPQNSDVVLILSQAEAAMKAFQAKYYYWSGTKHLWSV